MLTHNFSVYKLLRVPNTRHSGCWRVVVKNGKGDTKAKQGVISMLKRLLGMTKKKPLHLRHEPSFVEQQHPLVPCTGTEESDIGGVPGDRNGDRNGDRQRPRHHAATRVPTLSLEQAKHLKSKDTDHAAGNGRQPITTSDALDQIRRKENSQHTELGIY